MMLSFAIELIIEKLDAARRKFASRQSCFQIQPLVKIKSKPDSNLNIINH